MPGDVQAIFLSEEDHALLKQVIFNFKNKPHNTLRGPPNTPPRGGLAMYLALPQTTIPGLEELGTGGPDGTGTGTGTWSEEGEADTPGSALCELYTLANGGLHPLGRIERVYNSSRSRIERDWVQVHQDRRGYWWAITVGSPGGAQIIRFSVYDPLTYGESPCAVKANILSRPYGISPVHGEDAYETVFVHDATGCHLNGPEEDLVGLGGHAVYMDSGRDSYDYTLQGEGANLMPPGVGTCPGSITPRWEILYTCCRQDRCDV